MIDVTVHSPDVDLIPYWDDLVSRASPNVFMSPAALRAAHETGFARIHVLLAWDGAHASRRLAGMWALQEKRLFPLWPATLEALPYDYAFLSDPVVDPAFVAQVMPAFLKAIERTPALPRVVTLKSMNCETASYEHLLGALAANRGVSVTLHSESRPVFSSDTQVKRSGERRKKLRQNWKRLAAMGTVEIVYHKDVEPICAAFETFLQLEYKSWKGPAGTALLCDKADATFVRRLVRNLAESKRASIEALQVDGRVIAAQVLMFAGRMCYTWKTAYDADYAKCSPGILLIEAVTDELLGMADIDGIDSCSAETSFMAQLWSGRRAMVDLLVGVGPGRSPAFLLEAARQLGREHLKQLRNRIRDRLAAGRAPHKPGPAAASPEINPVAS